MDEATFGFELTVCYCALQELFNKIYIFISKINTL
jgi:hypothetical protein